MTDEASVSIVGETIVDMQPVDASEPDRYERRLGGAPANVAVGLARLGMSPRLWSRVGNDPLGAFCRERLAAEGVETTDVRTDPDAPTGLSVVSRDADGDRSFTLYLDGVASTRLDPDDLPSLDGVSWLHVGGVELAHEPARSAVLAVLEGVPPATTVSFDPNYRAALWDEASAASANGADYADSLARVLPAIDVVVASPEDLAPAGYDGDPATLARDVLADGPHTVFVTLGADGAVARANDAAPWGPESAVHDGFDPSALGDETSVVDTTGAGDAFTAGVIHTLCRDVPEATGTDSDAAPIDTDPLARATTVGNAVGAWAVTGRGATTALPDRAAVHRLVATTQSS